MPTAAAPLDLFQAVPPCCQGPDAKCVCLREERVLRAYVGGYGGLPSMTFREREWCLDEIHSVEGYDRKDFQAASDAVLAQGVLSAWLDYCRDMGVL